MGSITTKVYNIVFSERGYSALNEFVREYAPSKIAVITDCNTKKYCLNRLLSFLDADAPIEKLNIPQGEAHKNIHTCETLWNELSEMRMDRKGLIINLGGGVVTDLGGFVASTFQRGVAYINIPTTLLAMVDASIGGKTGVDLGNIKNRIGVISFPKMVVIDSQFLETLPERQIHSGIAEMLKHGLIASKVYWDELVKNETNTFPVSDQLIRKSICIKKEIVEQDPDEQGLRKILNFGHTLGHAIESHFLPNILHGEAIAAGMVLAAYLSHKILNFPEKEVKVITGEVKKYFPKIVFNKEDISEIIRLLQFDKKNENGNVRFVLLKEIARPEIDCLVSDDLIISSFEYYNNTF